MRKELFVLSQRRGPGLRYSWQRWKDSLGNQNFNGRGLQQGKVRAFAEQYTYDWYTIGT